MISIDEIINEFKSYRNDPKEIALIKEAYEVARVAHEGQKRKSQEPYIVHPLSVAKILVQLKQDWEIICSALLHDTVEDTDISLDFLKRKFGKGVSELVSALTKIRAETIKHIKAEHQAKVETIKKIVAGTTEDPRVIIIKLADRWDNMRTLEFLETSKRKRIAHETLSIYAPFADKLGLAIIKRDLQDLSFKFLKPREHQRFSRMLSMQKLFLQEDIRNIKEKLSQTLNDFKIKFEIFERFKTPYSLYQRQKQKLRPQTVVFEIVTDNRISCYLILGKIHEILPPTPGSQVKDFIAIPRSNGYQSLHTQILFNEYVYPIHIFTDEMYKVSQYGIIAGSERRSQQIYNNWLELLKDLITPESDSTYFLQGVKEITQQDRIYVCTPKGDYWAFPLNSIVLDFAYHIHTDIGHHCAGAYIDEQLVGPYDELRHGSIVKIITSPEVKPKPEWLTKAKTPRAHNAIKNWLDSERRIKSIEFGKEILRQDMKRFNLDFEDLIYSENFEKFLAEMGISDLDDFFARVGKGIVKTRKVISHFIPPDEFQKVLQKQKSILSRILPFSNSRIPNKKTIKITDTSDAYIKMSKCCNPLPGDDVIALISRKHGQLSIHKTDCHQLKFHTIDEDTVFKVKWDPKSLQKFPTALSIKFTKKFSNIIAIFEKNKLLIEKLSMTQMARFNKVDIYFSAYSKEQVHTIIEQIKSINGVQKVERL